MEAATFSRPRRRARRDAWRAFAIQDSRQRSVDMICGPMVLKKIMFISRERERSAQAL